MKRQTGVTASQEELAVEGSASGAIVDQGIAGVDPWLVKGTKTNNAASPTNDNLGVLPAVANAAAPVLTEGRQVLLSTDLAGALRVAATIDTTGLATAAKQDTGNTSLSSIDTKLTSPLTVQATNLDIRDLAFATDKVDISGSTVSAGVNLNTSALNLEATQALIKAKTDNIPPLGQALAAASVPVVLTAAQLSTLTPPAAITGFATETTLAALNTKVTAVDTGAVVVSSSALPTGASTAALQTQPGVDIGDVTINNASGAAAVNIQDGGNSLTVDGTVTANAGTNLNTSALALETTLGTRLTESDFDTKVGSLTETAPATDTASSGLNGRLQRIAQRITSLITALGSPFQAGGSIGNTAFGISTGSNVIGALTANQSVNTAQVAGTNTVTAGISGMQAVGGNIAHDTADTSNPLKIGGRADTTFQTAVADGDRVDALFDVYGHLFIRKDHANLWSYHENSSSALTDTSVKAAPAAGFSIYVTDIVVSLGSASAFNIFFEEGSTTILGPYYLEAVNGRSIHIGFQTPKKLTAATALTVTTSAAVAHSIDITGFIAP